MDALTAKIDGLVHIQVGLIQAVDLANRRADKAAVRNSLSESDGLCHRIASLEAQVASLTQEREHFRVLVDVVE